MGGNIPANRFIASSCSSILATLLSSAATDIIVSSTSTNKSVAWILPEQLSWSSAAL